MDPDRLRHARAFVQEPTDAGTPEPPAEVLARTHAGFIDEKLATEQDLKELELRLTLRLGSMTVVAVGAVAAPVKLLQANDPAGPSGAPPHPRPRPRLPPPATRGTCRSPGKPRGAGHVAALPPVLDSGARS